MENGKVPRRTQARKPRQVRPTPRAGGGGSDAGEDGKDYSRARRPDGKKKRQRAGEDDDEPRAYGASRFGVQSVPNRADREPVLVDFQKLDMGTLKRYKKVYRLKTRQNVTKADLALACARDFASRVVDEAETINNFLYHVQEQRDQQAAK
ncbi:hypothetical protein KFE25_004380 [Diacronema lutheri]|uniref:Histone deacetylase complex subunit SAP30 Sin3 binding domain-containing protein n=1 Tax=Diacronema lutheri TaxID=2081491 RepID=A0A8J6C6X4_DIALT|nr:hypothetical protein KFE25_004380 [Diacronema lutheri]